MTDVRDRAAISKEEMRRELCGSDDLDSFLCFVDHSVQCGNHLAHVFGGSDLDNYINGDIEFAFEYDLPFEKRERLYTPPDIPTILAEAAIDNTRREVWDLSADDIAGNSFVFSNWGGKPMPILCSEIMDSVEQFIPSRLTMGFQRDDGLKEGVGYPVSQSVLYGFNKPVLCLAEGKLNIGFGVSRERGNDLPIGVIEGSPKSLDDAVGDVGDLSYDGFVAFSVGGALSGLLVRFENVSEGVIFSEQFGKLRDVFRGSF